MGDVAKVPRIGQGEGWRSHEAIAKGLAGVGERGGRGPAVLYALASALLPQGGGAPDLRREVIAAVDGLVSTFHPADQAELKTAMLLFENALIAFVLDGRAQPLSALDPVAARRALLGFQRSRLAEVRTAFRAIRGLICGAWGAMPALDAVTGYPGPPDFGQACAADPWTDQPACPAEVSP